MGAARKKRTEVTPPGVTSDEKTTLLAFLDYLRQSVADKAVGVPEPQVREPGVASGTMRWTLVHMIEETGRHAGHADIIRERIDGSVGR